MAIMTAVMIATYFFKLDLKFEYDNLNNSSCTPMFFSYQIILIYITGNIKRTVNDKIKIVDDINLKTPLIRTSYSQIL
jgi:hypothetical protein